MITYIYQKDSTLWAFEGPERPVTAGLGLSTMEESRILGDYGKAMSTARESALPVVNAELVAVSRGIPQQMIFSIYKSPLPNVTVGETVPLPGWGLEIVMSDGWQPTYADPDNQGCTTPAEPEAYRLKRSCPNKCEGFPNTDYKCAWPENSAHGYTEGAKCESNGHIFEGTVIEGAERCQICGEGREPSESQEETQDILWMEAFHLYNSEIWNLNGRNKLKEKFTITRK